MAKGFKGRGRMQEFKQDFFPQKSDLCYCTFYDFLKFLIKDHPIQYVVKYSIHQAPQNFTHAQRAPHVYYRNQVINQLQTQHSIIMLVAQNLSAYMNKARTYAKGKRLY